MWVSSSAVGVGVRETTTESTSVVSARVWVPSLSASQGSSAPGAMGLATITESTSVHHVTRVAALGSAMCPRIEASIPANNSMQRTALRAAADAER